MIILTQIFDHFRSCLESNQTPPADGKIRSGLLVLPWPLRVAQISLRKCVDMKFERDFWVDFGWILGFGLGFDVGFWGLDFRFGVHTEGVVMV